MTMRAWTSGFLPCKEDYDHHRPNIQNIWSDRIDVYGSIDVNFEPRIPQPIGHSLRQDRVNVYRSMDTDSELRLPLPIEQSPCQDRVAVYCEPLSAPLPMKQKAQRRPPLQSNVLRLPDAFQKPFEPVNTPRPKRDSAGGEMRRAAALNATRVSRRASLQDDMIKLPLSPSSPNLPAGNRSPKSRPSRRFLDMLDLDLPEDSPTKLRPSNSYPVVEQETAFRTLVQLDLIPKQIKTMPKEPEYSALICMEFEKLMSVCLYHNSQHSSPNSSAQHYKLMRTLSSGIKMKLQH